MTRSSEEFLASIGQRIQRPAPNRRDRRAAGATERRAMGGNWPMWERHTFPPGTCPGDSWAAEFTEAYSNGLYAVLVRYLDKTIEGRVHLAIRTPSNLEPPWRDLQRIKNELFGDERFAVQVCPPVSRLIDAADMYHLWVMPVGYEPGFGLHDLDEGRAS